MIYRLQQAVCFRRGKLSCPVALPAPGDKLSHTLQAVPVLTEAFYQSQTRFVFLKAFIAALYQVMYILPAHLKALRCLRKAEILEHTGFVYLLLVLC